MKRYLLLILIGILIFIIPEILISSEFLTDTQTLVSQSIDFDDFFMDNRINTNFNYSFDPYSCCTFSCRN